MPIHAPKQWGDKIPESPLPLEAGGQPSNTPMPRPTPLTRVNGIRIQSAVLPQYPFRTDRHAHRLTDGLGEKPVPRLLTL